MFHKMELPDLWGETAQTPILLNFCFLPGKLFTPDRLRRTQHWTQKCMRWWWPMPLAAHAAATNQNHTASQQLRLWSPAHLHVKVWGECPSNFLAKERFLKKTITIIK